MRVRGVKDNLREGEQSGREALLHRRVDGLPISNRFSWIGDLLFFRIHKPVGRGERICCEAMNRG